MQGVGSPFLETFKTQWDLVLSNLLLEQVGDTESWNYNGLGWKGPWSSSSSTALPWVEYPTSDPVILHSYLRFLFSEDPHPVEE